MGIKQSNFQPGRDGKHSQVAVHPGMNVSHSSDRTHIGEHAATHGYDGGKPPLPKHGSGISPVHGGMHRVVGGKVIAGGGHEASMVDGGTVPAARNMATPTWGNSGLQSGNPVPRPAAEKRLKAVPIAFGQSRGRQDSDLHELGTAMLEAAFANSDTQTCVAHSRNRDGSRR
jgi:hypothetical protein